MRPLSLLLTGTALLLAHGESHAAEPPIALGEISTTSSLDVAAVRDIAEGEIKQIDTSRIRDRRHVVVSLALRARSEGTTVCTVNAMVRDARTGNMIAIIEGGAHAEGASVEVRKQVAHAAVRRTMRRIPNALGSD